MSGESIFGLYEKSAELQKRLSKTESPYTGVYDKHMTELEKPSYSTFFEKGKEYDGTNVRFFKQREAIIGKEVGNSVDPQKFLKRGEGIRYIAPATHEQKVFRKAPLDDNRTPFGQGERRGDNESTPTGIQCGADGKPIGDDGSLGGGGRNGESGGVGHRSPNTGVLNGNGGDPHGGGNSHALNGYGSDAHGGANTGAVKGCGGENYGSGHRWGDPTAGDPTKNFVASNIVEISNMVPRRRKIQEPLPTSRRNFGKEPAYLSRVKKEVCDEKAFVESVEELKSQRQQQAYAQYVYLLSREEHEKLLQDLRKRKIECVSELQRMPFSKDTIGMRKHKAELEKTVTDIEVALKKLDRDAVFIYKDDPVNGQWSKEAALKEAQSIRPTSTKISDKVHLDRLKEEVNDIKLKLKVLEESKAANKLVGLYASRKMKKLDIKRILAIFNDRAYNAPIFCHKTLPIVLAHFITELDTLPSGLNAMQSISRVRETLLCSFQKLINCQIPITDAQAEHFRRVLEEIEEEHAECRLLETMAFGILELREHVSRHREALLELKKTSERWASLPITEDQVLSYAEIKDIQAPLDSVNRCMITYNFISRMFLNHDPKLLMGRKPSRVGMVDLEINLEHVVRNAVEEAKQICTDHYGDCPDTEFELTSESKAFRFPYMSTTIRYIILELMKNAFRATVESHMKRNSLGIVTCDDMPPVRVLINLQEGTEHACICISDEGMGMTAEALAMAMAYSYTSVSKPALELSKSGERSVSTAPSPLAGYGYGLPMSRVYARSLGGDLFLQTMEGYGTRAYYYIKIADAEH